MHFQQVEAGLLECIIVAFGSRSWSPLEERRPCVSATLKFSPVRLPPRSVVRVITARLPVSGSASAYLRGVDCGVAAVLVAKKTVLAARSSRDAVELREQLDHRIRDMAARLGRAAESPGLRRFPPEIARLPEMLFHLRRGPLLGSILGHEDERAVLRHCFLQVRAAPRGSDRCSPPGPANVADLAANPRSCTLPKTTRGPGVLARAARVGKLVNPRPPEDFDCVLCHALCLPFPIVSLPVALVQTSPWPLVKLTPSSLACAGGPCAVVRDGGPPVAGAPAGRHLRGAAPRQPGAAAGPRPAAGPRHPRLHLAGARSCVVSRCSRLTCRWLVQKAH